MKTLKIYLILLAISFPFLIVAQPSWSRVTPLPQENTINDIIKIPGTDNLIAVCGGSIYMISEDVGNSWQVFTNPANKDNNFGCVSGFFTNSSTGFITGNDKSILKTTNGGQTWAEVYSDVAMYYWEKYYDINFYNTYTGVTVGYDGNILFSNDGGDTWDSTLVIVDFDLYAAAFCTSIKVFAVGNDHNNILISNDAGETWNTQAIYPPIPGGSLKDILFLNNNVGFITVNNSSSSRILRTENGGENWATVWTGYDLPNKIDFYDDMHGAVSWGGNMYESGVLLTNDGGLTWEGFSPGGFSWHIDKAIIMTDNNDVLIAGSLGRIFKSDFGGQSWDILSDRTFWGSIFQVQFTDALTGYALAESHTGGMAANNLMKTTNGGLTWNVIGMGDSYSEASFCFVDNETGYYASNSFSTEIRKTTNGGEDWVLLNSDTYDFNPLCIKFFNESFGLICGTNNIIRTTDAGNTWELVYEGYFTEDHWDIHFKSENEILVTGADFAQTFIINSLDGGNTWESEYIGNYGIAFDIDFINPDTGFIACENNMILKTIDGGGNWDTTSINSEEGTQFFKIQFPSNEVGYASADGSNATLFKTTNFGANWEPETTSTTGGLLDIHFFNDESGLAFGHNGLVIKKGDVLELNPPENFTLEQDYNFPLTIFHLNWEEPDLTNTPDLAGYNIYRNDTLLLTLDPGTTEYEEELNPFAGWGSFVCYYLSAIYENPSGESVSTQELCGGWLTEVEQNNIEKTEFLCYPNPFTDKIGVSVDVDFQEQLVVSIYDLNGKLFQINTFSNNQNELNIDLSGLENGIYLCNVKFNNGEIVSKKIVKSN